MVSGHEPTAVEALLWNFELPQEENSNFQNAETVRSSFGKTELFQLRGVCTGRRTPRLLSMGFFDEILFAGLEQWREAAPHWSMALVACCAFLATHLFQQHVRSSSAGRIRVRYSRASPPLKRDQGEAARTAAPAGRRPPPMRPAQPAKAQPTAATEKSDPPAAALPPHGVSHGAAVLGPPGADAEILSFSPAVCTEAELDKVAALRRALLAGEKPAAGEEHLFMVTPREIALYL